MGTETWFGISLAAVAVWGLGTVVSKPATMRMGSRTMLALIGLGEGGFFLVLFLLAGADVSSAPPTALLAAFLAATLGTLGYVFYYQGIAVGTVGLVGMVTAAYPVPTILLSFALLRESVDASQAAGIVLVLLCVIVLSLGGASSKGRRLAQVFALLAFLAWGLWGFFAKVAIDGGAEGSLFGFYSLARVTMLGGFVLATRRRSSGLPRDRRPSSLVLAALDVASGAVGTLLLILAYAAGPASLVTAVTGAYPAVATPVAHVLLHERFGRIEAAAVALFVLGIVLLAL